MKRLRSLRLDSMRSEFVRNSLTLISGTTLAQFIAVLITPILSRIYSTEDFGELSLYMSITGILSVLTTMRYEMAVVLPEKDEEALNVMSLSFVIATIWSLLSLVAVFLFGDLLLDYLGNTKTSGFLYFVPLVVLLLGMVQVLNYWSIRMKTFKNNAYSRIGNAAVNNGLALGFGYTVKGSFGLLLGFFFAQLASFLILARGIIPYVISNVDKISWSEMKKMAKRYRNFPKINAIHALVDSFQDNGIIFFIKNLFGLSILGSYSFAYRLLKLPTSLISSAIAQVFMEKATKAVQQGENIRPLLLKTYRIVFLIGAPFFLILMIFSPDLFAFVFSEKFREAGEIAQVLIPWMFLNFVANSASSIPIIFNRLAMPFLFTCIDICLKVLSLFVGWYFDSYLIGFTFMSITCSILMIITFMWVLSIVKHPKTTHYA